MNTHKQKTRPIGREQIQNATLALSVRKGVVNEARPSFYVMIVKHGFEIYERAQPDFSEARARRKGGMGGIPPRPSVPPERSGGGQFSTKYLRARFRISHHKELCKFFAGDNSERSPRLREFRRFAPR
ncbi:MAG: hypothetical protein Q8R13_04435 [bacterium]|nr:hypothetical protein [bacterium]